MAATKKASNAPFKDAEVLRTWDDGYSLVEVKSPDDMEILSQHGGGCSYAHWHWTECVSPQCEYFFVITHAGKVGNILFCKDNRWAGKKHPQDGKKLPGCKEKGEGRRSYDYGENTNCVGDVGGSDYYDRGGIYESPYDTVEYYERRVAEAKSNYERVKARALTHGSLGRDNPLKYDVDRANRNVTTCQKALDQRRLQMRLTAGHVFQYQDVEIVILQVAGAWNREVAANTRYTNKFLEWMEENKKEFSGSST